MKIGINAQILRDAGTGVARYASNVVRALDRIHTRHSVTVFSGASELAGELSHSQLALTSSWIDTAVKRILWEQLVLPLKTGLCDLDLMYYPDHTAPLFLKSAKTVLTIHDLAPLAAPETHGWGRRTYKSSTIRRSVARADKIVTVSFSTYRECLRYFDEDPEKFVVIHGGVDPSLKRTTDKKQRSSVRNRFGISKPFILYVGTLESRKNIVRLIEAFALLKKHYGIRHQLVLVGGKGHGYDEILHSRERCQYKENIVLTNYVETEVLPVLYSTADVFVYPSLYEGFGFPPLEAMACGCPAVVSNATSLPEVVGDAALQVDPLDVEGLASALASVLTKRSLSQELVRKGFERVKMFSWDRTAKELMNVFESLHHSGSAAA